MNDDFFDRIRGAWIIEREDKDAGVGDPYTIIGQVADELNGRLSVQKRGFLTSFPWEQIAPLRGHTEPVGRKWTQWIGWLWTRGLFAVYQALEHRLERSRHFRGADEYGDAEFRPFEQKVRWVDD
jgi:hypothetical protein